MNVYRLVSTLIFIDAHGILLMKFETIGTNCIYECVPNMFCFGFGPYLCKDILFKHISERFLPTRVFPSVPPLNGNCLRQSHVSFKTK